MSDVDFHITDDALEEIANIALAKQTGACGLRSILENMLMETMFVVPNEADSCNAVFIDSAAGELHVVVTPKSTFEWK